MPSLSMLVSTEQSSSLLDSTLSFADVADRVIEMQKQESSYYRSGNGIKSSICGSSSIENDTVVDAECRAKMAEWCYQVCDFCKFSRQTVAIGMSYLDRFMSTNHPAAAKALCSNKLYQLAAMTCLYIAIKIFEPIAFDTYFLSEISHGYYDKEDVEAMERIVLQGLSWRLNGPTSRDFLNYLFMLLPDSYIEDDSIASVLLDFSGFQAEIAVSDHKLSLEKPSIIALAAILNSAEGISKDLFPADSRREFIENILELTGINAFSVKLNAVRVRLLSLFEANSGYQLPQIANLTPIVSLKHVYEPDIFDEMTGSISPISVISRCA